jgi:hypothetical protein
MSRVLDPEGQRYLFTGAGNESEKGQVYVKKIGPVLTD